MPREDDEVFDGIDAPRRMPPSLRAWLEAELIAVHPPDEADATAALLAGIDGPRPLPPLTRMRVTQTLLVASVASRRAAPIPRARRHGWGAVAAIALAIVSSFAVMPERTPQQFVYQSPSDGRQFADGLPDEPTNLLFSAIETRRAATPGVGNPGFAPAPSAEPVGPPGLVAAMPAPVPPPAPPFAFSDTSGPVDRPEKGGLAGQPFRISVIGGDSQAEAGFQAYVNIRNAANAGRTRPFEIVGPSQEADVTVNLSGTPRSMPGVGIESLLVPDRLVRGDVFSFAGTVDRQARLIVDAVYPQPVATPETAVIYREPAGALYDDVPAALSEALATKRVATLTVDVHPGQAVAPVAADAVFLSLQSAAAKRVVEAYPAGARPRHGFNGLGTLAESGVVTGLPPGTRFISPYAFPPTEEAAAIKEGTGLSAGASVYHGWIVAKTLAVAVWRENPQTPDQLKVALQRMANYANGFAPAYTYRPGTNSVQPEGVLFIVGQGGASQFGEFRNVETG